MSLLSGARCKGARSACPVPAAQAVVAKLKLVASNAARALERHGLLLEGADARLTGNGQAAAAWQASV